MLRSREEDSLYMLQLPCDRAEGSGRKVPRTKRSDGVDYNVRSAAL